MRKGAGFTLIELLITITVMVILVTIAAISLRGNQIGARDEKRKTDVTVIAQQMENYYTSGTDSAAATGSYPSTQAVDTEAEVKTALRDLDSKVLRAPDVPDSSPMSFTVATTNTPPSPGINSYVYQPLTASGALCQTSSDECRQFTIYYILEQDGSLQKVVSKNQ
jgi:prepilin-type N-terminal cleavage/methylation domain-containing protein